MLKYNCITADKIHSYFGFLFLLYSYFLTCGLEYFPDGLFSEQGDKSL